MNKLFAGLLVGSLVFLLAGGARAAEAHIIVDDKTGHILEASGANEKRQIGSLTKVATAAVVLDMVGLKKIDLNEIVTIPEVAMRAGGANPVGFQAGDAISLRDLIYCALLASDNIAATAIANHAGSRLPNPEGLSPVGNFVAHMNALARGLGMKRTLFLNPTGLDNYTDQTPPYSTAADMARLTRYAYSEADFPFYVSQQSRIVHVFRGGQDLGITVNNTNQLLDQDGIDGVKTGRTNRAGDCIILSAERDPEVRRDGQTTYVTRRRIHVVVLGSTDRVAEGRALTQRGWSLYSAWASEGRKTNRSKAL